MGSVARKESKVTEDVDVVLGAEVVLVEKAMPAALNDDSIPTRIFFLSLCRAIGAIARILFHDGIPTGTMNRIGAPLGGESSEPFTGESMGHQWKRG